MRCNIERVISLLLIMGLVNACSTVGTDEINTYSPVDDTLHNTIYKQDSILFQAFNSRDFERFKEFFTNKLEIYQDNIGVRNYNQSMEAFHELFDGAYVLTRQLVKGTLEVYPIKDYGAIEIGQHTFCHFENGKSDCGTFKFIHIWENQNGNWKINKIITYGHKQ